VRSGYLEIQGIYDELDAADQDARRLVEGLTEAQGSWRQRPGAWSVAECLEHLAVANRVYLAPMKSAADAARRGGRMRRRPARPGLLGAWFVRSMEPPVRMKIRTNAKITPRLAPPLADALAAFLVSEDEVRSFVDEVADLDLAGIRFANPFIPGLRWSLATGIHVIAAHDRRHLWQAWNARRAALGAAFR
jgi:hypothetical protein